MQPVGFRVWEFRVLGRKMELMGLVVKVLGV